MTEPTKLKRVRIDRLARQARSALEALLDALSWPSGDLALHRAIDRVVEIEEDTRAGK